jgi:hypothetical protein
MKEKKGIILIGNDIPSLADFIQKRTGEKVELIDTDGKFIKVLESIEKTEYKPPILYNAINGKPVIQPSGKEKRREHRKKKRKF